MIRRASIVLVASVLCGCVGFLDNEKKEILYTPDFFSCNYWIDRNQNGKIEIDEWEGIKDCFLEKEHISFVAYFRQKPGTPLSFKLIAPDGSIYREKQLRQTAKTTIWCQEYEARDLINERGQGVWRMEWYASDRLVNITYIRIFKFPQD
ncbi:MAG: hypothetical protein N2115_03740 [bacterium]|nr:hypothetical protein [bacterium]